MMWRAGGMRFGVFFIYTIDQSVGRDLMSCLWYFRNIIMRELAPQFQIPWSIPLEAEDIPIVPTTSGTMFVHALTITQLY